MSRVLVWLWVGYGYGYGYGWGIGMVIGGVLGWVVYGYGCGYGYGYGCGYRQFRIITRINSDLIIISHSFYSLLVDFFF